MDIYELHKKIKVVLDEEKRAYASRGRRMGKLGSLSIGLQSEPDNGWTTEGQIPQLLFDESKTDVITSPNATLLLRLYSTLDQKSKGDFKTFLITHLRKDSQYVDVAYVIFLVLYRIGSLTDALSMARKALSGDAVHGYSNLLATLSMVVSREYLVIEPRTYETVELILQGDTEYNFRLLQKINLAKLKHLEIELSDVNPELNSDRDKVVELWGRKFPESAIPTLVTEIEDYFRQGELSATKFATCIGRIRVLLVEVSKQVALSSGKGKIKESPEERYFFDYLKDSKQITLPEWNILRSLYDLASSDGAHAITSKREYARLVKNMTYEFVLLLLSKQKNRDEETGSFAD